MKAKNIFWGLFFIAAAALIIINQMGMATNFSFLKAAGGVILIAIAIEGCFNRCFGAILFPLALIGILFAKELSIESLTPWPILLVALLATIGLTLMFPKRHHKHNKYSNMYCNSFDSNDNCQNNCNCSTDITNNKEGCNNDSSYDNNGSSYTIDSHADNNDQNSSEQNNAETDSDSFVNCSVKFGSIIKYVNSTNFQRAEITAHFGGAKVFFDNAVIAPGTNAVIDIDASFSGVELFVPRNWRLINNADISLGAIDEKNHYNSDSPINVTLTGHSSFCGIEITYI